MSLQAANRIAREILKKSTKQSTRIPSTTPTTPRPSSPKRPSQQLQEPTLEDEFRILIAENYLDPRLAGPRDLALQELRNLVTRRDRSKKIDHLLSTALGEYQQLLRTGREHAKQRDDRNRRKPTPSLLEEPSTGEQRRRDSKTRPTPFLPPPPSRNEPPVQDDERDIPEPPIRIPEFPTIPQLREREEDLPVPTTTPPKQKQDKPRRPPDVPDCEEVKRIARLLGLPEPLCTAATGERTLSIRGFLNGI